MILHRSTKRLHQPLPHSGCRSAGWRRRHTGHHGVRWLQFEPLEARRVLSTFHVALTGNDGGLGTAINPFRTIQKAVDQAAANADGQDVIRVEAGTYDQAVDGTINIPSSANVDTLEIEGGYQPAAGFTTQNPVLFPTFYSPAAAAGDQVLIHDEGTTITDINFSFDGTADGIVIDADNTTLDNVSVTGAFNGVVASGRSWVRLLNSGSSNNNGAGVVLTNAAGATTITGGQYSGNVGPGLTLDGAGAGTSLSVDIRIVASGNGGGGLANIQVADFQWFSIGGTNLADVFDVSATQVGVQGGPTFAYDGSVANLVIHGLDGQDAFAVAPSTATVISIYGDEPTEPPGDRLALNLAGVVNPVLPPAGTTTGAITSDSHEEVLFFSIEHIDTIAPDSFEENDTLATATILGSLPKITLRDLTIHERLSQAGNEQIVLVPDVDFYKYTAQDTGRLVVNMFFDSGVGNLDLQIRDVHDNIIAVGGLTEILPGLDAEMLVMPVVSQEEYFLEVFGPEGVVGRYDLEIENFPAPAPSAVILDPNDDTGILPADLVTYVDAARVFVQADLADFDQVGIPILTAAEANAGVTAGAAVEVFANGQSVGFADPLAGTSTLFAFTFDVTADTDPDVGPWSQSIPMGPVAAPVAADALGYLNIVSAAVRIFDGQHGAGGAAEPATGRGLLSEPRAVHFDPNAPATALVTLDMLSASDTGISDTDNVTALTAPAFSGVAEANTRIRLYANGELVGQATVGSDRSDVAAGGAANDGLGLWEITAEPLADGVHDMTADVEDLAGNISDRTEALRIEVDTLAPNTPFLDLVETSDSGRHDDDNITNDNTPTVSMTTADPNADLHQLLFEDNLVFRIFDRFEASEEFLLYDSAEDAAVDAVNVAADGLTALNRILETLPDQYFAANGANVPAITNDAGVGVLTDGIHNLKLEVADRAGNISEDFLLDLLIDTVAPPVSILSIDPATTDTGVKGYPATIADRVTSDTGTGFLGRTEAAAIVRLYADATANNAIDNPAEFSLTVAVPLDGDDAFPDGQWLTAYLRDLNDPNAPGGFPLDGVREILVTAEDLAGNVNQVGDDQGDADQVLDVFIDTQGPRITDVDVNNQGNLYDLFNPKPSEDGPTPLVDSLVISVRDLPNRSNVDPDFLYDALFEQIAEQPGHYRLRGDHNGLIAIDSVQYVQNPDPAQDGQPSFGTITLNFAEWLPDDRFTLTISDTLVDPVGNALDGENNAVEPQENPLFPTGDGQPGGDFTARFTIDSRAEIGVWSGGSVYVDTNGNSVFDPEGKDNDDTNEDIVYVLGFTTDNIFAGNFADGPLFDTADGFDKLAAYGRVGGTFRFLLGNNNGVPSVLRTPGNVNGLPVAGNFDGNAANGDEVGVFTGTTWYLANHAATGFARVVTSQLRGLPIVGDFGGPASEGGVGLDDLATYNEPLDRFEIDFADAAGNYDGHIDRIFEFGFPGIREYPVAADMDGDGFDDMGLFAPDRGGMVPRETGEWYILVSDGAPVVNRIVADIGSGRPTIYFTPEPFGPDLLAQFGDEFAVPVLGNFDPPTTPATATAAAGTLFHNAANPLDVTGDGVVAPIDALRVINDLNAQGARPLRATWTSGPGSYVDTNGDGHISPIDALRIINELNRLAALEAAAGAAAMTAAAASVPVPATDLIMPASRIAPQAAGTVDDAAAGALASLEGEMAAVLLDLPEPVVTLEGTDAKASRGSMAVTASAATGPLNAALADIAEDVCAAWRADLGAA